MKKYIIAFIIGVATITANYSLLQKNKSVESTDLLIENIDALASGEVDIPGLCIAGSPICIVFSDGYFVKGTRVA